MLDYKTSWYGVEKQQQDLKDKIMAALQELRSRKVSTKRVYNIIWIQIRSLNLSWIRQDKEGKQFISIYFWNGSNFGSLGALRLIFN